MTDKEATEHLAHECPRKILGHLHAKGDYIHCTRARVPGKVYCFSKGSELPADCYPTEAQAHFWQMVADEAYGAVG